VSERPHKQRRFPRIVTENVALVRTVGEADEVEGFAKTRSLGLGGCGFVTDQALTEGSTVHLLVSLSGRAIAMTARVVYSRPLDERWDSGVEFVDIEASDLAFLKSKLPDGALKD